MSQKLAGLKKEFQEKDVERLRNLITGKYGEKTHSSVGFTKADQIYNEGDIWEENGRTWTIKEGIKQNITKLDKAKKAHIMPLLCPNCGKIMIFSLETENNKIPTFKVMKLKLDSSLKRDKILINEIKKNLKKYKITLFEYKVNISKIKYIQMIKSRYISCLLKLSNKQLQRGIDEIKSRYKSQISFIDILNCIIFKK